MKRVVTASAYDDISDSAKEVVQEIRLAMRNLLNVLDRNDGNLEQILIDPDFSDKLLDEIRHLDTILY